MNTNVTKNKFVNEWIAEMAAMVKPSEIILIDVLGDSSQFNRAMSESGVYDKRSIQLGGK